MINKHTIKEYDRFPLRDGTARYTIDTILNECEDIKVGDVVLMNDEEYTVQKLTWFNRLFDDWNGNPVRGENCTIEIDKEEFTHDKIETITLNDGCMELNINDGNVITIPYSYTKKLSEVTDKSVLENHRISSTGLHFPDIDEDISWNGIIRDFKL